MWGELGKRTVTTVTIVINGCVPPICFRLLFNIFAINFSSSVLPLK